MNENRAAEPAAPIKPPLAFTEMRRGFGALILLTALALAGNYFALPLFFGVDFLFGSIFVLFAIHGFGAWRGGAVALVASLYTLALWHHPYGASALVAEALFVGFLLRRARNMLLLDGVFWVALGMPFVYLTARYFLKLDGLEAGVIALKDGVNGLFNALIASLLVKHVPSLAWPGKPRRARLVSLRQAAFNIVVGCALVPALILMVLDCQRARHRVEDDSLTEVTQSARQVQGEVSRWNAQRQNTLLQIAKLSDLDARASTRSAAEHDLALLAGTLPDALAAGVRDENARDLASFASDKNARAALENVATQQSQNGALTDGTRVFSVARRRKNSETIAPSVLAFEMPLASSRGFAMMLVSRAALQKIVERLRSGSEQISLLDQYGRVLASTRKDVPAFSLHSALAQREDSGSNIEIDDQTAHWFPTDISLTPMMRWKKSALIHTLGAADLPWKIVVEKSFAGPQRRLQMLYFDNLALMMALSLAALALAGLISRELHRPLYQLAQVTHNLPQRLQSDEALAGIQWPRSSLDQMQALIGNFQQMSSTLRDNFRDVASTRARLEDEQQHLQEANRLKDEFLAVVSHELRTPLVPIIGYADLLSRDLLETNEDRHEAVCAIERNARLQLKLIEDLLDVSRIVAGQMRIENGVVDVADVVRESLLNVQLAAHAKAIEIASELAADLPPLPGDRSRLTQVMWNLLVNSIKFTPPGGAIHVALTRQESFLVVTVRDSGHGINADFLPHVFARFRQAAPHLTRSEGGLGLGLAIVHDIVELHGGTIEAFSGGENCGATFVVKLPLPSVAAEEGKALETD